MAATSAPRLSGRFDSRFSDDQLLDLVAKVARHTDRQDPTRVSQRRFDKHRAAAGEPECPKATGITTRLNADRRKRLSWEEILEAACGLDRSRSQSMAKRVAADKDLDQRHVYFALRRVDAELRR